jgi:glycosyltransferase involved in cell wall biosynthesis
MLYRVAANAMRGRELVAAKKILMVGPYPPPEGGWSTAIREEREELLARGFDCKVLNLGANRRVPGAEYLCVRNGPDLAAKLLKHCLRGYTFRLHMNGDSFKGMGVVFIASCIGAVFFQRSILSFHAGERQRYFPHRGNPFLWTLWRVAFNLPAIVVCDSPAVRDLIRTYRRGKGGVYAVSPFSRRRVAYEPAPLDNAFETFLSSHRPVLFSYFAYRPEYTLDALFEMVRRLRAKHRAIGLLAVDDRSHPDRAVFERAKRLLAGEGLAGSVLLTGEVGRNGFLTLLGRADLYVRTPMTDGVCSSVLEALHFKVPVVASDNGGRPPGVVTFVGGSVDDMESKVDGVIRDLEALKRSLGGAAAEAEDGVGRLADIIEARLGVRSPAGAREGTG